MNCNVKPIAALFAVVLLAGTSTESQVHANAPLVSLHDHGPYCGVGAGLDDDAIIQAFTERDVRPMPKPAVEVAKTGGAATTQSQAWSGWYDPPLAGLVPADYINPVDFVREHGHLRQEVNVHVAVTPGTNRLEQVLSFEAPDWARMMLVEFRASDPLDERGNGGIHLRPHNPFVEGEFPAERQWGTTVFGSPRIGHNPELGFHVIRQEAYRSSAGVRVPAGSSSTVVMADQYILVTRDMDPAPAGRDWHVAISSSPSASGGSHVVNTNDIEGTLRVYFSGQYYRPPLAIQFYYDPAEVQQQIGFFDPTPRVPDGDNPGTTIGEAWRWVLFKAAEQLLDELDFDGFLPINVLATSYTSEDTSSTVSDGEAGSLSPRYFAPPPGRARTAQLRYHNAAGTSARQGVHPVAFEREAGTDACRANPDVWGSPACLEGLAGQVELGGIDGPGSQNYGWIRFYRDGAPLYDGETPMVWNLNLTHNPTTRVSLMATVRHELLHVLGFAGHGLLDDYEAEGFARHHGYHAAQSSHNPWRNTDNPGIPVGGRHLFRTPQDADPTWECEKELMIIYDCGAAWKNIWNAELAKWLIHPDYHRGIVEQAGIVRDILLDEGYASNTYAVQERSLPRHWYDPVRSGHGVDVRRAKQADGSEAHFLHFYTYDANGDPEWYIASGELSHRMVLETSLDYVTFDENRSPAVQIDPSRSGTVRLDLDPPIDHPACAGRYEPPFAGGPSVQNWRHLDWLYAVLEFDLPDGSGAWCLEPLKFGRDQAYPHEGSGSWYAADPEDSGWGLSVMTRMTRQHPIVHTVAYYYDANGEPTWAIGTEGADESSRLPYRSVGAGVEIDMLHVHGFCRTCEPQATPTSPAGIMRLRINEQSTAPHSGNWIERLDLTDQSPTGGRWLREDIGIRLLSSPHPSMADY